MKQIFVSVAQRAHALRGESFSFRTKSDSLPQVGEQIKLICDAGVLSFELGSPVVAEINGNQMRTKGPFALWPSATSDFQIWGGRGGW